MSKMRRILRVFLVAGAVLIALGCASEQAEHTTNRVTNSTSNTVGSVLDGVGSVIMYPFHVVGDLFS
jgi:CHASE3 domain sensor protein